MHELALAHSLTEMVDAYVTEHGVTRVKQINVRLGQMSAMTRALHVCFSSASEGTSCEGATLNIDEVPLTVFCGACDAVKTPTGKYSFRCPDCGMPAHEVVTGREMQLVSIELIESDETPHVSFFPKQPLIQSVNKERTNI